jgi:hypothetical protein
MHCVGQCALTGLAEQQVNVLGHDHVSVDAHLELAPHAFQTKREQIVNRDVDKIGPPTIATEGDEVRVSGLVKPP